MASAVTVRLRNPALDRQEVDGVFFTGNVLPELDAVPELPTSASKPPATSAPAPTFGFSMFPKDQPAPLHAIVPPVPEVLFWPSHPPSLKAKKEITKKEKNEKSPLPPASWVAQYRKVPVTLICEFVSFFHCCDFLV
jgi:hypothetical protein